MMSWTELLSTRRLGRTEPRRADDQRSPFEIDVDRFVFCSAFRRLQSKMQVHGPLLGADRPTANVRNRLTHSLEASRVGRSLGQLAGQELVARGLLPQGTAADVGHIVSGAAIAHDIGQTPFSHEAEQAISEWWEDSPLGREVLAGLPLEFAYELTRFDGNAFGFRLLTRLEGWQNDGGLQLTCAMLGAFAKYPWSGGLAPEARPHPRKYGIFGSEIALFREVAAATGLVERGPGIWCRHPLAYLTEAADDICYLVVDIEDAVQVGALPFREGEELLSPLAAVETAVYRKLDGVERRLTYLRARAISTLIGETIEVWHEAHDAMLEGATIKPLLDDTRHAAQIKVIQKVSEEKIYRGSGRAETALIANRTLTTLLDSFAAVLLRREQTEKDADLSIRDQALMSILGRGRREAAPFSRERALWVRELMDHIAALTDPAAMHEARTLAGGI
ncbi:MAG TPA: dNTP triphosphohydrolase [Stellaceae bacterium]|nr:dNTP triphosphohydrolase [Stellaceae bacterium]